VSISEQTAGLRTQQPAGQPPWYHRHPGRRKFICRWRGSWNAASKGRTWTGWLWWRAAGSLHRYVLQVPDSRKSGPPIMSCK